MPGPRGGELSLGISRFKDKGINGMPAACGNGGVPVDTGDVMVNVLCAGEGRPFSMPSTGRTIGLVDPIVGLTCGDAAMVNMLVEGDGCP